jgi:uncharacterized protein (DUF1499 family)
MGRPIAPIPIFSERCRRRRFTEVFIERVICGKSEGGTAEDASRKRRLHSCERMARPTDDESHGIAPLTPTTDPGSALECLKRIIEGMKRTKIVLMEKHYIHAELRTFLGFIDDVELYIDEANRRVQMRSASRLGYWDFGVNRRRLEEIRRKFDRECQSLRRTVQG